MRWTPGQGSHRPDCVGPASLQTCVSNIKVMLPPCPGSITAGKDSGNLKVFPNFYV